MKIFAPTIIQKDGMNLLEGNSGMLGTPMGNSDFPNVAGLSSTSNTNPATNNYTGAKDAPFSKPHPSQSNQNPTSRPPAAGPRSNSAENTGQQTESHQQQQAQHHQATLSTMMPANNTSGIRPQ